MVKIRWTKEAVNDLSSLDPIVAKRIVNKLTWVAENFSNLTPEPLSHTMKGLYKVRIGDWRVVYSISKDTITILYIGHRSSIYRKKKQ